MSQVLYFDCPSGASGDMILAALLDCGIPTVDMEQKLGCLPLDGYTFNVFPVEKKGLRALKLDVSCTENNQPQRNLAAIAALLERAPLSPYVRDKSLAVFQALARAEAKVHGLPVDEVHFHEIGAVDSIVDIVGTVQALELLGIHKCFSSALPLGHGWQKGAHGLLPLPAPATLEIISDYNIPCYGISQEGETVTPTGAALIAVLCSSFSIPPPMQVKRIGYGAGQRDFNHPNILRAWQGSLHGSSVPGRQERVAEEEANTACLEVIEANIDDMNPEIYDYLMERLFANGALDVYFSPVQMKKNRPAVKVTILANPQQSHLLGQILLQETTTIGYRRYQVEKVMLEREEQDVETPWGRVKIKVAGSHPHYHNIAPEYADCLRIAREKSIPLKKIYQYVMSLYLPE